MSQTRPAVKLRPLSASALVLLVSALLVPAASLRAQTAPAAARPAAASAPLLLPAGLHYRYWPMQIVQFVGPELPYDTIVLNVDDRAKEPAYDVTLTTRPGGQRIHYVNQPALVTEDKAKGDAVYLTAMQFDHPDAPAKQAQYMLRFNTEKGVPVLWQFVEGTDLSEQGSGVTPIDAPFPIFMFREQGALAGEGTALKIGDVTSTADVWKEYAQPPYFIPYHGALSEGVHTLSIAPGPNQWTGTEPTPLTEGADWKLTAATGLTLSAHVDSLKAPAAGAPATAFVSLTDTGRGGVFTLEAEQGPAVWTITRVRFGPVGAKPEHTLSMIFTPGLADDGQSRFEIVAGKKTKVAAGTVAAAGTTDQWTMTSPGWAKGKTAKASSTLAP